MPAGLSVSAPAMLALETFHWVVVAPTSTASRRSAPARSAPERSAPERLQPFRLACFRFARTRRASLRMASVKSAFGDHAGELGAFEVGAYQLGALGVADAGRAAGLDAAEAHLGVGRGQHAFAKIRSTAGAGQVGVAQAGACAGRPAARAAHVESCRSALNMMAWSAGALQTTAPESASEIARRGRAPGPSANTAAQLPGFEVRRRSSARTDRVGLRDAAGDVGTLGADMVKILDKGRHLILGPCETRNVSPVHPPPAAGRSLGAPKHDSPAHAPLGR